MVLCWCDLDTLNAYMILIPRLGIANLSRMLERNYTLGSAIVFTDVNCLDFPETITVYLEESYRSTGSIVSSSLAVASQCTLFEFTAHTRVISPYIADKQRVQKSIVYISYLWTGSLA
jgi:hypothetical protein